MKQLKKDLKALLKSLNQLTRQIEKVAKALLGNNMYNSSDIKD